MKREILITSDGSTTIHLPEWNEQYHSKHGAIQEAYHVFIHNGLSCFQDKTKISVLEIGLGTGLNCFITFLEAKKRSLTIDYAGIDAFPVKEEEVERLNYVTELQSESLQHIFKDLHRLAWEEQHQITSNFSLTKRKLFFENIEDVNMYNLIYFDAFGARVQPELWTESMFERMYLALRSGGVLVTYSAKGSVRRAMQKVGFEVERLPGPPGKREMLRGKKHWA